MKFTSEETSIEDFLHFPYDRDKKKWFSWYQKISFVISLWKQSISENWTSINYFMITKYFWEYALYYDNLIQELEMIKKSFHFFPISLMGNRQHVTSLRMIFDQFPISSWKTLAEGNLIKRNFHFIFYFFSSPHLCAGDAKVNTNTFLTQNSETQ